VVRIKHNTDHHRWAATDDHRK